MDYTAIRNGLVRATESDMLTMPHMISAMSDHDSADVQFVIDDLIDDGADIYSEKSVSCGTVYRVMPR